MISIDRTTKILLALIILFLAILTLRPMLPVGPSAQAADNVLLGATTKLMTRIPLDSNKTIKGIYVIDNANAFVVQYPERLDVYRIFDITADTK